MGRSKSRANKNKTPKLARQPNPLKAPRIANDPPAFRGSIMSWRFNAVDKGGPFSWLGFKSAEEFRETVDKLAGYETMNEASLASAGCHAIPIPSLSTDARARLVELELDDLDELFSFRITGPKRVFGVVRPKYVRLLWFDPLHQVCPSPPKHT